ncbi:MAG: hypothetical protein ACFE9D_04735 [Promethearchaeota archaeon]
MSHDVRRVYVISFDFKQPKGSSQARKTRFFRELYGYTQQIKQELKDGEIVTRTYHYPGVLDQIPYVKLGKSVIAIQPGTEDAVLNLLHAFEEVVVYSFIGWLPIHLWPKKLEEEAGLATNLIGALGYYSILLQVQNMGGTIQDSSLLDVGFDTGFIDQAIDYLTSKKLLSESQGTLTLTTKGKEILTFVS